MPCKHGHEINGFVCLMADKFLDDCVRCSDYEGVEYGTKGDHPGDVEGRGRGYAADGLFEGKIFQAV